jgi:hypothetical protein
MAIKKNVKRASVDKSADALFLSKQEDKEKLDTPPPSNNHAIVSSPKNTLYKYKDGSTCRVCYDGKEQNYIVVNVN